MASGKAGEERQARDATMPLTQRCAVVGPSSTASCAECAVASASTGHFRAWRSGGTLPMGESGGTVPGVVGLSEQGIREQWSEVEAHLASDVVVEVAPGALELGRPSSREEGKRGQERKKKKKGRHF